MIRVMTLEQDGLFEAPDTPAMPAPAMVSQAKAAHICGVSTSTIRRARQAGKLEGCRVDEVTGGYLIPVPSLLAAGFKLSSPTPSDTVEQPHATHATTPQADTPDTLHKELLELREKLIRAEHRAQLAEAVADERAKVIQAQKIALKMLTSGHDSETVQPVENETTTEKPKRFRWPWQKKN